MGIAAIKMHRIKQNYEYILFIDLEAIKRKKKRFYRNVYAHHASDCVSWGGSSSRLRSRGAIYPLRPIDHAVINCIYKLGKFILILNYNALSQSKSLMNLKPLYLTKGDLYSERHIGFLFNKL